MVKFKNARKVNLNRSNQKSFSFVVFNLEKTKLKFNKTVSKLDDNKILSKKNKNIFPVKTVAKVKR